MEPEFRTIAGQPSWTIRSDRVELSVTRLGGHMAPVTFCRDAKTPVRPYYISPWQEEDVACPEPVLKPLRGDFFCMPFGGDNAYRGEDHPAHGETATGEWTLSGAAREGAVTRLSLTMDTSIRPGAVTKHLRLVDGHNVVYVQHVLEGHGGSMPLGHHATLAVGEEPDSLRISTSPTQFGMTNPALFSDPAAGEYQSLAIGRRFRRLDSVPLAWREPSRGDCSTLPQREGFTDLLALFASRRLTLAWTAAVAPREGYLWFSMKDPRMLPATVMWIANRGRHGAPWLGRNRCVGLEDVCAYFADGLRNSAGKNALREAGVPTVVRLSKRTPTRINYIEGAVRIPKGFDRVKRVDVADGVATFTAESDKSVRTPVFAEFLQSGELRSEA